MTAVIERELGAAVRMRLVDVDEEGRFALSKVGQQRAQEMLGWARSRRNRFHRLLDPGRAARTAVAVQIGVSVLKVPAALISLSLAQINDDLEEVLDVVTSGLVYLGVRTSNANRRLETGP